MCKTLEIDTFAQFYKGYDIEAMKKAKILWVDDEIDLLKPYIFFLKEKGYDVDSVNNGRAAIELCGQSLYHILFLDEHMPGLSGLDTLVEINALYPNIPVVMITKSEDEGIMTKAIGNKIADYLIKPVNPNQILLSIRKILDKNRIISETNTEVYRDEFRKLSDEIGHCSSACDWIELYKKLVYWEVELSHSQSPIHEMILAQKEEANRGFGKFIKTNYQSWFRDVAGKPVLSPAVFSEKVYPVLDRGEKLFFVLIDNFRFDQWQAVKDVVAEHFAFVEDAYFSILPTTTQYARNALFAGLNPFQIAKCYPDLWVAEEDDDGKNVHENTLIGLQLNRNGRKEKFSYHKINSHAEGEKLLQNFAALENNELNVVVFNFMDMFSHVRNESKVFRELTFNESAYRSLTKSWALHSSLMEFLKKIAEKGYKTLLTTDHGAIRVKNPRKVIGEKDTTANLRHKTGRNLEYDFKQVFQILQPENVGLPASSLSARYIFALGADFFVYPNNYNHYASFYENTFQHGGVSLEEMIVPLIMLQAK